jgi:serine/threonine-protein kinase
MTDSHPPSVPIQIGELLAGKYRVERVLGAGGMGVVVEATHLELEQQVAVKFLLAEAVGSPDAAARFVREARAAVKIKSEHVARVIDVGRLDNGAPYIVMEFLHGHDLGAEIARGRLTIEDAVDYVIQACDAMAEAHAAGIVHRDLKPSNLFLSPRSDGAGHVKVLDFGISKVNVPDISEASLTKTSTLMGSPYYMSPEQMRSARTVDHRTDVWSLGVILYELLAGTPPFHGESLPHLFTQIMTEPPLPLAPLRPDVPPELEQVLIHCLTKDREQRYQSVGEFAAALMPFAPRRSRYTAERIMKVSGIHANFDPSMPAPSLGASSAKAVVPSLPPPPTAQTLGARTNAAWSETRGGTKPGPRTAAKVAGGVAGVALLGAVLFFALRRAPEVAQPSPSSETAVQPPPQVPVKLLEAKSAERVAPSPPSATVAPVVASSEPELVQPLPVAPRPKKTPSAARPEPAPEPKVTAAPAPEPPPAKPTAPPKTKSPLSIDLK